MSYPVSVIVATFRREGELERALNSLANQSYRSFEIVLVDDNGEESWNKIVKAIADGFIAENRDTPLRLVVNEKTKGSAMAKNAGVAEASGTYITFLDDDDVYHPGKIENQLTGMADADYSITDLRLCRIDGREVKHRQRSYIEKTDSDSLLVYHLMYHMTGTDTLMLRRSYFDQVGGFPPIDVGDEFYLMQRAIMGQGKFAYVKTCDVTAYIHTGEETGLSSGETKIHGENQLYEYKKEFFHRLDAKTIRYIKMRHYAVLAFAEIRRRRFGRFFCCGAASFFSAPLACIKLLAGRSSI